jgi:iron complex transport system substrate-binding protein
MKTKNKTLALMEIAIVLCSMFLVAIPAIAANQNQELQKASASVITTASEDDYVLGVYGNANEDDTIDMGDVVYTKLAIFGKKPKTELCDAKYDGRINVLDVIQTKLIILGKEKELTIVDANERIVTVKKPISSVVCTADQQIEALRILKVSKDKIVGVPGGTGLDTDFFPEYLDKPTVDSQDPESILKLDPDLVLLSGGSWSESTQKVLEAVGITVLCFSFTVNYPEALEKFGYAFDKRSEAEKFLDWYGNILNTIEDRVKKIPDGDKPKVYPEGSRKYGIADCDDWPIALAGGKDIFVGGSGTVDAEAVIDHDPDIIIKPTWKAGGYSLNAGDTGGLKAVGDEVMGRSELQKVKAVKDGRVYVIITQLWTYLPKSGNRHFIGICYMAKWFHPELFEDLDPNAIHQEYLTRFQGLDIDLDEKGVFVYHPEEHPDGH